MPETSLLIFVLCHSVSFSFYKDQIKFFNPNFFGERRLSANIPCA